ncbi:malto-oligosyltrehalose synthase [Altererythrobacter sp. B11]|uniref:malto-oligosyltrehalose synthase n=1 Tax=Altererythrobacter sp. B11 TaxID=2060312 RepID=UPI000DC70401|nr:malto-oligosyltrehalose synthase [Altererythrobacter sp. B11]BBC73444.1 malto-oligosyltrehalose synthase [Altererythrobacter sp. B11]
MIPRATYRFQFRREFPFARAEELVPYLDRLGISHIYASPVTTARSGSPHGYDVVDPTRINPELGGEAALRSLVSALKARGMGLIIDIVPNHMGVAGGENAWWNDVLAQGEASPYARFFDVDWSEPLLLPILGSPLEQALEEGAITIDQAAGEPTLLLYGEHRIPLRPEDRANLPAPDDRAGLTAVLERQHYRLGWWRVADDELNWRRFFTINDLAGLRIEDDTVFEATHALYFRLWREGLIDGVRVDHVDGLTDPGAYCRKLRRRFEQEAQGRTDPAYIVVEKILGPSEHLPADWEVDGTSGYDFMEQAAALLHDPAGEQPLGEIWRSFSGRAEDFAEEELQARQDMLSWAFSGQLERCVDAFAVLAGSAAETRAFSRAMLRRAIERLLWVFPVYRTYGTGADAPASDARIRQQVREAVQPHIPPGEAPVVDSILAWLAGEGPGEPTLAAEAVRRFQQLSAPVAAKAVEDTAFYRHGHLLSRMDVGFDPACFAMGTKAFHRACAERGAHFPHAMLATATHDHKRGEDMRARLAVLSAIPHIWRERVTGWDSTADGPSSGLTGADRYILYQTLFGAWPERLEAEDREGLGEFARRLIAWQEKALREAKLRSSWEEPDAQYEGAASAFITHLLESLAAASVRADLRQFVTETRAAATANSLAQVALRYTVPGVPDLYQGTELPDLSLVDPDNRTPVDYTLRQAMLAGETAKDAKLALIERLLAARRDAPELFGGGDYRPARVTGERAGHVLAFTRRGGGAELRCAVLLRAGEALHGADQPVPSEDWWADTAIVFEGDDGASAAAECFAEGPVFFSLQQQ